MSVKKDYVLLSQLLMLLAAIGILIFWIEPDIHRAHASTENSSQCVPQVYEEECDIDAE